MIDSGSEQYGGFPGVGDPNGIELTEKTRCVQVTGNNIFNWGGQGIMKYAVYEDETCDHNSFTSLNLNYFEEGGVVSRGKNSLVKDIVYIKEPALILFIFQKSKDASFNPFFYIIPFQILFGNYDRPIR